MDTTSRQCRDQERQVAPHCSGRSLPKTRPTSTIGKEDLLMAFLFPYRLPWGWQAAF
jgi:hypothetical protein